MKMAKMKIKLSVIFPLWFLPVMVFGDLDSSKNPNPSPAENFKALEDRIRELEKSHNEFKDLKVSHEKSQEKLKKQVELLEKKVEKLEQGILENEGIGMLRPPLRGPPGKKGDRGEIGPPGPKGDQGILALQASITSCSVAMEILPSPRSQKQRIYPHGNSTSLEVLCDFEVDGGGWTIIQKRSSGPAEEFNRTWAEYSNGFGSLDKNFWIGLDNIRALTQNGDQELRIELEDFEGNKKYAKYSSFSVSDASDFYRLSISGYSGDAGNDMTYSSKSTWVQNGMRFSTFDKDNDQWIDGNCAVWLSSGWWFNACHVSNLNGLYFEKGETVPGWIGIMWYSWKGDVYSLAKTEMKIRTRK